MDAEQGRPRAGSGSRQPVVTDFEVRKPTYPKGHWMNRYWGRVARFMAWVIRVFPLYRFVQRASPEARALLATGQPVVFACTHQDLLDCFNGLPRLLPGRRLVSMSSPSRDGDLAATLLEPLGYEIVRGSSARRGIEGLLKMRNRMRDGASAVFACDGPKAPLGDVKPGVVMLARGAHAPIIPIRAWGAERMRLDRSWTRMTVSCPMLPVAVFLGPPLHVDDGRDVRDHQIALTEALADLARKSSVWAGGPPVSPFKVAKR